MNTPRAIAYAGYPGAGKSKAAEAGVYHTGGELVSMGECVKEIAYDELGPNATSHEIGHFATVSREINGPEVMAERIIEKWDENGPPREPVHIEGVRSVEEVEAFESIFGEIPVLFIYAEPEDRLTRLQARDRDEEGDFDVHDLLERDGREAEWGLSDLERHSSYHIPNYHDLPTLRNRIGSKLHSVFGFPFQQ